MDMRNFKLVKNDNGVYTDLNITINLNILNTLPFIVIDEPTVTEKTLNIVTTEPDALPVTICDPGEIQYLVGGVTPLDANGNPTTIAYRYSYVGSAKSAVSKNRVDFYYDNVEQDIVVIPDLNIIVNNNVTYTIYGMTGHRIGSGTLEIQNYTTILPVDCKTKLPKPSNIIPISHSALVLPGLSTRTGDRRVVYKLGADTDIIDNVNNPVGLLDIGTFGDLFGTDITVGIYALYMDSTITYRLCSMKERKVTKAYVLLDF